MDNKTLSEDLLWRGLIKDTTFKDMSWLNEPKTFYLGVDCNSADSLTIGNLTVFLLAKRLKLAGWNTILLVGGATSLVGDPGGKDEERPLKSREEIQANVKAIEAQVTQLFSGLEFKLVDNYDWFKDMNYLEFLRDVGKNYSMTELLQREFISTRLGENSSGISYAEFSYTLIQGYDYYHLFKEFGCVLQIGGSDQWGNMLSGAPLVRKKENAEVQALSMPLVIDESTGKKFGKSEAGAVWLNPAQTSPFNFYQFWMNVDDLGLETYLKVYTFLSQTEIESILNEHKADPSKRTGQAKLAREVTTLVHGADVTERVVQATQVIAGDKPIGEIDEDVLSEVRKDLASIRVKLPVSLIDALVSARLAPSNSEARRLIESRAVYVNGQNFSGENLTEADFQNKKLLLRRGKAYKDTTLIELDS